MALVDLDYDGAYDLVVTQYQSSEGDTTELHLNQGSAASPSFSTSYTTLQDSGGSNIGGTYYCK